VPRGPELLHFTDDDEANRLLASDPLALLIGLVLDQQVPVQKAFSGPLELKRRLGGLDAGAIAALDPDVLVAAFKERPALHRFPAAMAARTQELCAALTASYGGDAARVWSEARDGADLAARIGRLPGFGDMKVATLLAVLAKRFGLHLEGLAEVLPRHATLGDVDSREALAAYQAAKRAHKAGLRAASGRG
jgi:uncharacterized HhH-GPD family protein